MTETKEPTVTVLKSAPTARGFRIDLLQERNRLTGEPLYVVARSNREGFYIRLSIHSDLTEARAAANREWSLETQAVKL